MKTFSFQSYAFQLRRQVLSYPPLEWLLDQHPIHRKLIRGIERNILRMKLDPGDRFAWKFIKELNLLNPRFGVQRIEEGERQSVPPAGKGVHQNLDQIVKTVLSIWFPEMENAPKVVWLKRFSTRKLAHYSPTKDEIAFSLIFDLEDTPAEILHYLAYHELLHRNIGVKTVNGRRYAHTPEFRHREDRYPDLDKIDEKIGRYLQGVQR